MFRNRGGNERERTGTPADWLVIGLGNPGAEYAHTRHNVGADAVDLLAQRHGGRLRLGKERALADEVRFGVGGTAARVALAFPQTYMNESGVSAQLLVRRYGIESVDRVIVVHDELDLPVGKIKVKVGGGNAGHNGLKSIQQHLKSADFLRVRIGIGKPPGGKTQGVNHVLKRPSKAEQTEIEITIQEAADAVETIMAEGVNEAMSKFNARTTPAEG